MRAPVLLLALALTGACSSETISPAPMDAGAGDVTTVTDVAPDDAADAPPAADVEPDAGACPPVNTDQPSPRGDAAGAVDPATGALFVFGGDVGPVVSCMARPEFSGETWRYDTRCDRWERLAGDGPSPRSRTAYALDARRRRLLVFGGRFRAGASGAYTLYRELWSLDLETRAWTLANDGAAGPSARANATLTVDDASDAAILFGGNTSTSGLSFTPRNDTWRLDLSTLQWTRVMSDTSPPARQFHAAAATGDGAVVVLGGGDANAFTGPFLTDAWRLDLAMGQWSRLALLGDTAALAGRISHGLAGRAGDVVVLAGHDDGALGNRNDVLTVDPSGAVTQRSAGDTLNRPGAGFCDFPADFTTLDEASPERRSAFVIAPDPTRSRVIVYGGKTDCGAAGDVWSLDLTTLTWRPLRATTDGLGCPRTGRTNCRSLCG